MFILPLDDPLWRKLDDAHRDCDIPAILGELSTAWDKEEADSLFFDYLCHQDTCYGATYASVPHLIGIAENPPTEEAARDIAQFLGYVSLVAFQSGGCCGHEENESLPQGLPLTPQDWDRKLEPYRNLAEYARRDLADPGYPGSLPGLSRSARQAELARYEDLLSRPPVDEVDLSKISAIRDTFLEAQPTIARLCEQALRDANEPGERRFLLVGVAASAGDRILAQFLVSGDEGQFRCAECAAEFRFAINDRRLAVYPPTDEQSFDVGHRFRHDPLLLDFSEGTLKRALALVNPYTGTDPENRVGTRLLHLASRQGDEENLTLLNNFLGSFICPECGAETRLS